VKYLLFTQMDTYIGDKNHEPQIRVVSFASILKGPVSSAGFVCTSRKNTFSVQHTHTLSYDTQR